MATEERQTLDKRRWRGLREPHLDLLLAEELAVNPEFAHWVAQGALMQLPDGRRLPLPVPADPPLTVTTKVSYWDPGRRPDAAGETDVLVQLLWEREPSVGLFVEDKLEAILQPWQAERYPARAASAEIPTATVLMAPSHFIDQHGSSKLFGKALAIEEVAKWLRHAATNVGSLLAPRLEWRANMFDIAAKRRIAAPEDPRAVRFTDLFAEAVEAPPDCIVDRSSCHTANQGWIWFKQHPALGFKAIHGFVDVYVKDLGSNLGRETVADRLEGRLPAGFVVAEDTVPNTVLRAQMPRKLDPVAAFTAEGNIADPETFEAATRACREVIRWLRMGGAALLQA